MHKDALHQTKPLNTDGFGDWKKPANFQMSQRMAINTEELARRSAIYASLADSMVASVISEMSPRDERTKLLKEKLAVIQEAQVAAIRHNNTSQASYEVEAIPDAFQKLANTASWLCGFDLLGEKRALMGYQRADTRLHSVQQVTHWGALTQWCLVT